MALKVLLVDDHKIMREGLSVLLRKHDHIEIVGEAEDGREAFKKVRELSPDLVIMDIAMPNLNGVEATQRLIHDFPKIKILALSTHSDRSMVSKMLKAGASGYMLKESAFTELIDGIEAVADNKTYLCPKVAKTVLSDYVTMLSDPQRITGGVLTAREREILQLVAEGETTKQIAAKLNLSIKTVDSHRGHIMTKLAIHNTANLTKYAIREGLTTL